MRAQLTDKKNLSRKYDTPYNAPVEVYDEPYRTGRHCVDLWGLISCQPNGVHAKSSEVDMILPTSDDIFYFVDPENTAYRCVWRKTDLTCEPGQ